MTTYRGSIVGGIWWPIGYVCALDVPRFEAEDDEDAVDMLATRLSGDFSEVMDVEVWRVSQAVRTDASGRIIQHQQTAALIKPFSEEAEIAYSDAMFGGEE